MKYDTAFTSAKHVGYIAYNKQRLPIAFYAVIPCFIRFGSKIVLSAQSADTMTHPDYRNKGLFVELALRTFQLCHSAGIPFVFGFPNQNSLPGFINKLRWKKTEQMDCFIIPAAMFSWGRLFNKFAGLRSWYARYRQNVLKKYLLPKPGVANSVFNDGFAGIYRDHQYLKYKTYNTTSVLKLGNATLWVKPGNVLLIGDIAVESAEFDSTMFKLKRLARKMGIKEIHFHASPGTTLHNLFSRNFASIPSFPVIFKDLEGGAQTHKVKFTAADIDTF
jgi:hypothetical protein